VCVYLYTQKVETKQLPIRMLGEFRQKLKSLKKSEGWDGSAIIHASLTIFFAMTPEQQKQALRDFRVSRAEEKSK
jgi:hypothetical protein